MMSSSSLMAAAVLNYPELSALIAQYLSPFTILQCMCVCRFLHQRLEPLLYRRLFILPPLRHSTIKQDDLIQRAWLFTQVEGDVSRTARRNLQGIRDLDLALFADAFLKALIGPAPPKDAPDVGAGIGIKIGTDSTTVTRAMNASIIIKATMPLRKAPCCTNLRRLKILMQYVGWDIRDSFCPNDSILVLLDHNPFLVDLCLPSDILSSTEVTERLVKALGTRLPRIKTLSIVEPPGNKCIPIDSTVLLLRTCLYIPSLQELNCDFSVTRLDNMERKALLAHLKSSGAFPKQSYHPSNGIPFSATSTPLSTLILPLRLPANIQALILRNCVPRLTKFRVASPLDKGVVRAIGERTGLRHLITGSVFARWNGADYEYMVAILNACENSELEGGHKGLQSFYTEYFRDKTPIDIPPMMEAILEHRETLEEIVFDKAEYVSSDSIQKILESCPILKRFSLPMYRYGKVALEFVEIDRAPWLCKGLKILHLTLNPHVSQFHKREGQNTDGLKREFLERIYMSIGALTQLEELGLEFDTTKRRARHKNFATLTINTCLTVADLMHMANLKRLRCLRITSDLWSGMRKDECEFMEQEWPQLEEIELSVALLLSKGEVHPNFWQLVRQEHWQWFKEQRPWLRFSSPGLYPVC